MKKIYSAGFTLIELSVSLIIIALLAGGILVGRDMINAAEIRAAARQIESFNTAYTAFLLKYNCMPGDCGNATDFGFTPIVVTISRAEPEPEYTIFDRLSPVSDAQAFTLIETLINSDTNRFDPGDPDDYTAPAFQYLYAGGNGNGDNKYIPEESIGAQVTLGEAHLIPGTVDVVAGNYPIPISSEDTNPYTHKHPSPFVLTLEQTTDSLFPGTGSYYVTSTTLIPNSAGMASFTAGKAYALDAKMDDGFPGSGSVRGTGLTVFTPPYLTFNTNTDSGPDRCIYNNQYNVAASNDPSKVRWLCTLGIKPSFL